jgi:hypothetical protein
MDKAISEKALVEILRGGWKDIEELYVTTMKKSQVVGKALVTGFLETTYDGPACPKLQRLFITYPLMNEGANADLEEQERENKESVNRLNTIIDGRKDDSHLQYVALGWYPATAKSVVQDKNDRWNVEWDQILFHTGRDTYTVFPKAHHLDGPSDSS